MNKETIKNNISLNIAKYRKKKKITQAQLAEILETKTSTVSTWERGSSLPDAEMLFKICENLEISLAMLYGIDTDAGLWNFKVSEIEKDIITSFRASDEISKAMVLRILGLEEAEEKKIAL